MTPVQRTALEFHAWGANVTAIVAGSKSPLHKWKRFYETPQTRQDANALPWDKAVGVGVLNGINGWRTFDIDAKKEDEAGKKLPDEQIVPVSEAVLLATLRALGLPDDYAWVYRSGSGSGWEIAYICHDELPAGVLTVKDKEPGVFWGVPKDGTAFDHIELRWVNCQTIYPPSAYEKPDAPGYQWRGAPPTEPPAVVSIGHVLAAFFAVAKLKPPERAPEPAPKPQQAKPVVARPDNERDAIDEIKRRFDLLAYARKHWPGETQKERNGEIRILGHGGLLINEDKGIWDCFKDGCGGDAIELVGYRLYDTRWDRENGAMFRAALEEAARETGVEIPTPRAQDLSITTVDGRRVFRIVDVTPVQVDGETVTITRADYERLCARAADAERAEAWRRWAETILSREGLKPSEKGVFVGLYPIIDARRALAHAAGNDDRIPLSYEHIAKVLRTSKSTVGRAVEIGEKIGLWRRDPETAQTKEGYDIQHMRIELQPAFDDPRQALVIARPQQGGARPGAGRKPKCPDCPAETRVIKRTSASYVCEGCGEVLAEELVKVEVLANEIQDETKEQQRLSPPVANMCEADNEIQDETGVQGHETPSETGSGVHASGSDTSASSAEIGTDDQGCAESGAGTDAQGLRLPPESPHMDGSKTVPRGCDLDAAGTWAGLESTSDNPHDSTDYRQPPPGVDYTVVAAGLPDRLRARKAVQS
jgi:hypothetical protein